MGQWPVLPLGHLDHRPRQRQASQGSQRSAPPTPPGWGRGAYRDGEGLPSPAGHNPLDSNSEPIPTHCFPPCTLGLFPPSWLFPGLPVVTKGPPPPLCQLPNLVPSPRISHKKPQALIQWQPGPNIVNLPPLHATRLPACPHTPGSRSFRCSPPHHRPQRSDAPRSPEPQEILDPTSDRKRHTPSALPT